MDSIYQQSAELIDLIERTGMRQELEARIEAKRFEKRKRLIAELNTMRKERDAVLSPLNAEATRARERVARLEHELAVARQELTPKAQREYGATCAYGEGQIISEIEKNAPKFMQDAFDDLQEPIDFLRGTVRTYSRPQRIAWSFHTIDVSVSNAEEIVAIRQRCEDGQAEIRAMMQDDVTPLDEHRARCATIIQECLALTQPHLKDDKHWLVHEQRKERARRKPA